MTSWVAYQGPVFAVVVTDLLSNERQGPGQDYARLFREKLVRSASGEFYFAAAAEMDSLNPIENLRSKSLAQFMATDPRKVEGVSRLELLAVVPDKKPQIYTRSWSEDRFYEVPPNNIVGSSELRGRMLNYIKKANPRDPDSIAAQLRIGVQEVGKAFPKNVAGYASYVFRNGNVKRHIDKTLEITPHSWKVEEAPKPIKPIIKWE